MAKTSQWLRVNKSRPCGICESTSWCAESADGDVAMCMRIESEKPIQMRDGTTAWIHRLTDNPARKMWVVRPKERVKTANELHVRFGPLTRSYYVNQSEKIAELAKLLGVTTRTSWLPPSRFFACSAAVWPAMPPPRITRRAIKFLSLVYFAGEPDWFKMISARP